MTALLALIPGKDWLYGALIVGLIVFGLHEKAKFIAEGIAEQKAADDKATAVLVANTAKQTADLQARATMAEQAYDKEVNSLANLPAPSVRLCVYPHPSGSLVSQTGTAQPGTQSAGSAAGGVQQMPPGNSGGRDIGGLLDLLAQRADDTNASLREFQSRDK
jgi:hypothetical protein